MTSALRRLFETLMRVALPIFIGLCLSLTSFGPSAEAAKTSMSGNYQNDTVSVARSLKEVVAIPNDSEGRAEAQKDSVLLITDYISRYRNRSEVNDSVSFTTMQTALNSMAGHIKTFSNRPIPEGLKERLTKELSKAEKLVVNEG